MPEFVGSFGEILERGMRGIQETTPIRQNVAGSKSRAHLEAGAREVERLGRLMETNLQRAFLPTATGKFLEYFGATVGLRKYAQANAEVSTNDRALRMSTKYGATFGSINGGAGFTVPAGTSLVAPAVTAFDDTRGLEDITAEGTTSDRSIHYQTTYDVYLASDATEVFLPARATTPGLMGNLSSPGMIKTHNFTGYSDYLGKTLLVTNTKPILSGTDIESEQSFRYRISKQLTAVEKANYTAITSAVTGVPGVADVVIIPLEDGAGRFTVYVKAISPTVPDRLLTAAQEALDKVVAAGAIGYARRPYEVGIEIDTNVVYRGTITESEKVEIRKALVNTAVSYVNSLSLGQPLILAELSERLRRIDSRVSAVGSDRTTLFDAIFAFFPARLTENGTRREKIIAETIVVPTHARIIIEPSLTEPVRFV